MTSYATGVAAPAVAAQAALTTLLANVQTIRSALAANFPGLSLGGLALRQTPLGAAVASGATATSSPTITIASVPSFVAAGQQVSDTTTGFLIGTVLSKTGTTVTLAANAASAITSGDSLNFFAAIPAGSAAPNGGYAPGIGQLRNILDVAASDLSVASTSIGNALAMAIAIGALD